VLERSINRKPLLIKWWMLLIKHGREANNFDGFAATHPR
jgi:hypothetical protein